MTYSARQDPGGASEKFFVSFFVLVMNPRHKEYPGAEEFRDNYLLLLRIAWIRMGFMPIKPTPTMPILTISKSLWYLTWRHILVQE
jgi:hypothetical protein